MTVFTTDYQNISTRGPDSQSHENEFSGSLPLTHPKGSRREAWGGSGAVKKTMKNQEISKVKDIRGFSLLELLMVMALVVIVGGISMMIVGPALESRNVEMAVRTVSTQMSRARQYSVDARRKTRVTFTTPGTITVEASQGGTWSQVSTATLPGEMEFGKDGSVAAGPEGYVTTQVASFGPSNELVISFMPDGSAVDSLGILSSGVVYVAQPSKVETTRAVTLFGTTGRIKRYTYHTGTGWE